MATFVLVPGAGGDAEHWRWVEPELQARGHSTIAVRLPAADDSKSLTDYADVIVAAAAGTHNPVLVAQSIGGFAAMLAAERLPACLLVYVCAMIPVPGESADAWWSNTGQGEAARAYAEASGRDPESFDDVEISFHDVNEERREVLLAEPSPGQSDRIFADSVPRPINVPTRAIAGRYDRLFPLDFMQRQCRERLGYDPDVLDSGHLPAFSRPVELSALLDGYARSA